MGPSPFAPLPVKLSQTGYGALLGADAAGGFPFKIEGDEVFPWLGLGGGHKGCFWKDGAISAPIRH